MNNNLTPEQQIELADRVAAELRKDIPDDSYKTMWGQLKQMLDEMQLEKPLEMMESVEDLMVMSFTKEEATDE